MRTLLFLLLLLVVQKSLLAEEKHFAKPNYEQIKKLTTNKALPTWYPKLLARYNNHDTTLTNADFHLLYYGFFFQPEYKKVGMPMAVKDSIKAIYKKQNFTNKATKDERIQMIGFTQTLLKTEPFNVNSLNRLYILYLELGKKDSSNLYKYKLEKVAQTLFASGDGKSDSTGIHVLAIDDEYSILSLLGYEYDGSHTHTKNHADLLKVRKNDDNIDGMYFDVKQILKVK